MWSMNLSPMKSGTASEQIMSAFWKSKSSDTFSWTSSFSMFPWTNLTPLIYFITDLFYYWEHFKQIHCNNAFLTWLWIYFLCNYLWPTPWCRSNINNAHSFLKELEPLVYFYQLERGSWSVSLLQGINFRFLTILAIFTYWSLTCLFIHCFAYPVSFFEKNRY